MTMGIIVVYLLLLLGIGVASTRFFKGTSADYFVAGRSIGPFMLLMSVFGTTMTAFALVGSTSKAYTDGIGTYGLMASWSGLVHSAVFFMVGIRLWAVGKRYGYMTQCQYFRDRFQSPALGYMLFPVLVLLLVPYLLVGLLGAGNFIRGISRGMYPEIFEGVVNATGKGPPMLYVGSIPPWITALVISLVVLGYVFMGGVRSAVWANTFQTIVFMITGVVAFWLIADKLGGVQAASQAVADSETAAPKLAREGLIGRWHFMSYGLIPLSVGMFPHLFQHWLTARSAKTFRLTVIFHPICIMIVWVPCILIGIWAAGSGMKFPGGPPTVLGALVGSLDATWIVGVLAAGVLAAIMSSLDSQFVCLGTMFTNDIVLRLKGPDALTDKQKLWTGRGFVMVIVALTFLLSLVTPPRIFDLGVWCFSGFSGLFPLVVAAVYWRRATKQGMIAALVASAITWVVLFMQTVKDGNFGGEILLFESVFTKAGEHADGLMPVTVIVAVCAITLVAVSLLTQPPPKQVVDRFFPDSDPDSDPA